SSPLVVTMTSLSPSDIRILEQTRQRLSQLTESLNSLNRDVHTVHPLPSCSATTTALSYIIHIPSHPSFPSLPAHNYVSNYQLPTINYPQPTIAPFPSLILSPPSIPSPPYHTTPMSNPKKNRSSLSHRLTLLSTHLTSLSTLLHTHAPLFTSLSIIPLPSYPRDQEGLLLQLLRKKLEPGVEGWVEEGLGYIGGGVEGYRENHRGGEGEGGDVGRGDGEGYMGGGGEGGGKGGEMHVEEWKELWEWAPVRANEEARGYEWFSEEFTVEEREGGMDVDADKVDDDDEEENEEDKVDAGDEDKGSGKGGGDRDGQGEAKAEVGKVVKMDDQLRFMSIGLLPR
ncbi:MAG: hypothetical protein Q9169_008256, partial [Polycauliona sp. 2 TL-2023]